MISSESGKWRAPQIIVVVVIVIAIGLRLTAINRSLWYDELFTWQYFISGDWLSTVATYRAANNHPLFSLLSKSCYEFLGTPWSLRLPALLAGCLLLIIGWRDQSDRSPWASLLFTSLLAFHPLLVSFSAEARGYAGATLFIWLLLLQVNRPKTRFRVITVAGCVLCSLWHHPASLLIVMLWPLGLYWADGRPEWSRFWRTRHFKGWTLGLVLTLVVYLKILKRLWSFARRHVLDLSKSGASDPIGEANLASLGRVLFDWRTTSPDHLSLMVLVILVALFFTGIYFVFRSHDEFALRRQGQMCIAVLPGLLFWLLPGTFFTPRFALFFVPCVLFFIAQALKGLGQSRRTWPVAWLATAVVLGAYFTSSLQRVEQPLQDLQRAYRLALEWQEAEPGGATIVAVSLGAELIEQIETFENQQPQVLNLAGQGQAWSSLVRSKHRKTLVVIEVYADQSIPEIRRSLDASSQIWRQPGVHAEVRVVRLRKR